jgi:hypothetical protein
VSKYSKTDLIIITEEGQTDLARENELYQQRLLAGRRWIENLARYADGQPLKGPTESDKPKPAA